jgi:hypothetical protein
LGDLIVVDNFSVTTVIPTDVAITSKGAVCTLYPKIPIMVPTTMVPFRGKFAAVPEVMRTITSRGFRPNMLARIDVGIKQGVL